jgi:hypothetical protein
MGENIEMDWTGCALVETDPDKVDGKPVICPRG